MKLNKKNITGIVLTILIPGGIYAGLLYLALKDVVKNGKTGVVIQNNSPQEMALEAIRLYDDAKRYQLYQKNGKEWVDSLQWDDVIKQSLSLLKKAT